MLRIYIMRRRVYRVLSKKKISFFFFVNPFCITEKHILHSLDFRKSFGDISCDVGVLDLLGGVIVIALNDDESVTEGEKEPCYLLVENGAARQKQSGSNNGYQYFCFR